MLGLTYFTEAIRLDHKFAIAYYNRGVTYVRKGDYESSITDLSQAIGLAHQSAAFHYRGVAYLAKGDADHALRILAKRLMRTRDRPKIIIIGQ